MTVTFFAKEKKSSALTGLLMEKVFYRVATGGKSINKRVASLTPIVENIFFYWETPLLC